MRPAEKSGLKILNKICILKSIHPLSVSDLALKKISEALLNQPIRTITYKPKDLFN
tara:strand:- start:680 stop:847 length:168 start_codon:yes stop_codon:yes gene_type:complete